MLYRCKNQSIYQVLVHRFGISYNEVKSADFAERMSFIISSDLLVIDRLYAYFMCSSEWHAHALPITSTEPEQARAYTHWHAEVGV